jgi:phage regulator Rha-like protein
MLTTELSTAVNQYSGFMRSTTMSSREIAELAAARHNDVVASIERLFDKGLLRSSRNTRQEATGGRPIEVYDLIERDVYLIISGYSDEARAKIIDRWQELEAKQGLQLPNFSDPAAAAIAWAEQYRARQLAEQTKAQIGHKREATAMATASTAVRKANKLEIELDRSKEFATVKRMEMLYHGTKFDWRVLKSTSAAMEMATIDVFDQNYGTVKAYHKDVWAEAFAVQIGGDQ